MASRTRAGLRAGAGHSLGRLVVTGLSVAFGGVRAVDGVDLSVSPGELVGFIGPNGAGKSTFVDAITGFVEPTRGQVCFGERMTTRWAPSRLAHAGLVRTFQHLELFDDLTVGENISVAARSTRRGSAAASARAVELCGLADVAGHLVTQVPAGRRRLVALARALAAAPLVLLADEPEPASTRTSRRSSRPSCGAWLTTGSGSCSSTTT